MIKSIDEAVNIPPIKLDLIEKFESRLHDLDVPSNPLVNINTRCILCTGHTRPSGYVKVNFSNKELGYKVEVKTHILSWVLFRGLRNGQQVQHLCGVKFCANPAHLILGQAPQNGTHASITRAISKPHNKSWKLSEPDRVRIRNLHWIHKYDIDELMDMYNVSETTIRNVLNTI